MEKYYIPLLFLAVIALALFTKFGLKGGPGLGVFNNQATQSANAKFPTTGNVDSWQLYTNSDLGFLLRLPPSWTVDPRRSDRAKYGNDVVFDIGMPESLEAINVDLARGKTVDDFIQHYDGEILSTSVITVDGKIGKTIQTGEMGIAYIYVVHDGKLYTFVTQGAFERDGVLATFKFL